MKVEETAENLPTELPAYEVGFIDIMKPETKLAKDVI